MYMVQKKKYENDLLIIILSLSLRKFWKRKSITIKQIFGRSEFYFIKCYLASFRKKKKKKNKKTLKTLK